MCVVLFTAKTIDQVLAAGGSQWWVISPHRMETVSYAILVRNSDSKYDIENGKRPEPHDSAFMVGKIKGFRKVANHKGLDRYLIEFSDYAVLDPIPDFRSGRARNPVTYCDIEQAEMKGLDIANLNWIPMPEETSEDMTALGAQKKTDPQPMTVEQAKEALALHFGVPASAIEIHIKL
jgi:hypothetical protein